MKSYQFYHIYPLGMLNHIESNENEKYTLSYMKKFIPHLKELSIDALYLGPVFESAYHGYDTIDYLKVDQRLGSNDELKEFICACHEQGIKVILDCVFNHVSQDFFAFKDCQLKREKSKYKEWFHLDFSQNNEKNDTFSYETWDGHQELVKLNLANCEVKKYLFDALVMWIDSFNIDGIRLDAADVMDTTFLKELIEVGRAKKSDFFIVGEIVHGDYAGLISNTNMDAVTNYECYKGLYSSLNDKNYFEIAYGLNRLFGKDGLLKDNLIYNFADNHDVDRVASSLYDERHLYPLYIMLYTMKGHTSLYYKSEFGELGKRTPYSDTMLRSPFIYEQIQREENNPLLKTIKKLGKIRKEHEVLALGNYEELFVEHQCIGYRCYTESTSAIIVINSDDKEYICSDEQIHTWISSYKLQGYDVLNNENIIDESQKLVIFSNWGRIIV